MIINKDCLEALKELPDNSIDSIVTDPPYGLSFMGKKWDYDVPSTEIWSECLRVLKPGGYLLAFAGTRTQHRMAVRIEDAGFEIRDMIAWVYGSGFPKSLNIGKAVDKLQGNKREISGYEERFGREGRKANCGFKEEYVGASGTQDQSAMKPIMLPVSEEAKQWEGWGTALKPALEPITVARKPIEGNVAQNCLKWGVGGINIDGCRVATNEDMSGIKAFGSMPENKSDNKGFSRPWMNDRQSILDKQNAAIDKMKTSGRFPANLIHDGSEEVLELFPDTKARFFKTCSFTEEEIRGNRLIYTAKASKSERNMGLDNLDVKQKFTAGNYSQSPVCKTCDLTLNGTNDHSECSGEVYYREMESKNTKNNHPTVKPIKLMEYLINLVSKEGHTVLDPFCGSGTTGIACKKLNRNFIGIERDEEYCKIAEARINNLTLN